MQTSPKALHDAAGLQAPPWQLVEQQSVARAQASPSVLQVCPVEPAGSASQSPPAPQMPEQQAASSLHDCATCRQATDEQVPPAQLCEQQSESVEQGSPA
jgi:hypothetical protein